jgi:hypothetical protein
MILPAKSFIGQTLNINMKVLGVVQAQQMKHSFLGFEGKFKATFGNVPKSFHCIIYGKSGQGKTEMCMQLAKYLAGFGTVLWLSYEQGHGADIQAAINRNHMEEVKGSFYLSDPTANLQPGKTLLQDLIDYLKRRGSPEFVFVDSVDYTGFKKSEYLALKERFKNKAFIWIGHGKGNGHKNTIGEDIEFDAHIGIRVDKYIGHVNKNRFSAFEPYIVWNERARLLNPDFFAKREKAIKQAIIPLKVAENGDKEQKEASNRGG